MASILPQISIIVPCYNEQEVIETTHFRLSEVLGKIDTPYEIIYVNDGSSDRTMEILREIHGLDSRAKVVNLSRNFGHQIAVSAGLEKCSGEGIVIIDADLQDPPELIPTMIERWRAGYHVVYGKRLNRPGESAFKLITAKWFYRILNMLSEVSIPLDVGDFRLIDRRIVDALRKMPERNRFLRGMISWAGYRQYALEYNRSERFAGDSKYPVRKMLRFATDGVLAFSVAPLRAAMWLGFLTIGLAIVGIVYALVMRIFTSMWVEGYTLMFVSILFLGGVQLLCLGVIGEYIGRIFTESKARPLYLTVEEIGF